MRGRLPRRLMAWFAVAALSGAPCETALAKDEIWRQESAAAFGRGEREGLVVGSLGTVRLARVLGRVGTLDVARVWDLALSGDGSIYAATGDKGQLWRAVRGAAGTWAWEVFYKDDDSQLFAVALRADGRIAVGTGPSGRVVEVAAGGDVVARSSLGPDVKYVWDLAYAVDGALYAATGPSGQLWKRAAAAGAQWELVYDSPQPHLLCVVCDEAGNIYAGSDGAGVVYRVDRAGKVSVLLDAPQQEVRALFLGPGGALYAGTATPAAEPSSPTRSSAWRSAESNGPSVLTIAARGSAELQDAGATAILRSGPAGENVVYRIEHAGAPREVFRAKALVLALGFQADRLLIGTGPEGRLYAVDEAEREVVALTRLDQGQVVALASDAAGGVLLGAGDPGAVLRLEPTLIERGELVSEVLDMKLASRIGSVAWRGSIPGGTTIAVSVRIGSIAKPDETWSEWVSVAESGGVPKLPTGRFAQYRATLSREPGVNTSPELVGVTLAYRTLNLPPEIGSINIPDAAAGDGTIARDKLELKWEASDPNEDALEYRLWLRKEGWPQWMPIDGAGALGDKTFTLDGSTVPEGRYRLKVEASDRRSNSPRETQLAERISAPFLIDRQAPSVELNNRSGRIEARARDSLTRVVKAEYAVDGGAWVPLFPDDGVFDSADERFTIDVSDLPDGLHVIVVRATDAAGHVGAADLVFNRP